MAKVILTTKVRPSYDDAREDYYHFPRRYLGRIEQAVGDDIIYYEPRRQDDDDAGREGRQVYFATARISSIEVDAKLPGHYYANIIDYIGFDQMVPFREGAHYYESSLKKEDGSTNKGQFGNAVRIIPDHEFELIRVAGFRTTLLLEQSQQSTQKAFAEESAEYERPIREQLVRRPFRDRAFTRQICEIYNSQCALTGIRLINGGGRTEVEAAHIKPIGDGHKGSDSVRNGIALCQTVHWMFDRGVISLADDYGLLVDKAFVTSAVQRLFRPELQAAVPTNDELRPHPQFLKYHRNVVCKGRNLTRA
jgi:putative restriction endonuclease